MVNANQTPTTISNRGLPLLSAVAYPKEIDVALISQCRSHMDAIRLCIHASNLSNQAVCDELGIDKGHWSRIMQGRAYFPNSKLPDLMRLCGNIAPLQYLASAMGYQIMRDPKEQKRAELLKQLAELDRAAA